MDDLMFFLISLTFWPLLIVGLIIFFVARWKSKKGIRAHHLFLTLSREEGISQLFFLLSFFFLGVTLFAFNRDAGGLVSWETIVLLTSLAALGGAYYFKSFLTLFFSIFGLGTWWLAEAINWSRVGDDIVKPVAILFGLIAFALLLYFAGRIQGQQRNARRASFVLILIGIIFLTITLFFFSTQFGLNALEEMSKGLSLFASWQMTLSLLVLLILIGTSVFSALVKGLSQVSEVLVALLLLVVFGLLMFIPQQVLFEDSGRFMIFSGRGELTSGGLLWALLFNLLIFFELLGLILLGYVRRETWPINLGTFFLFLLILVKYFDWFFTFLDKSIFFIGAGILLFLVGWIMERGRRYVISSIKQES